MILTEKEEMVIRDLQTQEQTCMEKYKRYAQEAKDPVLKELFQQLEKDEQEHFQSLGKVLAGEVPCCDCNDSQGQNYKPQATYTGTASAEDKKSDCFWQQTVSAQKSWFLENITRMFLLLVILLLESFWRIFRLKNKIMRKCYTTIKP